MLPFTSAGCIGAAVNGGLQPCFAIIFSEIIGVFALTDEKEREYQIMIYSLLFCAIGVLAFLANIVQVSAISFQTFENQIFPRASVFAIKQGECKSGFFFLSLRRPLSPNQENHWLCVFVQWALKRCSDKKWDISMITSIRLVLWPQDWPPTLQESKAPLELDSVSFSKASLLLASPFNISKHDKRVMPGSPFAIGALGGNRILGYTVLVFRRQPVNFSKSCSESSPHKGKLLHFNWNYWPTQSQILLAKLKNFSPKREWW